jgi:hypothetical protein
MRSLLIASITKLCCTAVTVEKALLDGTGPERDVLLSALRRVTELRQRYTARLQELPITHSECAPDEFEGIHREVQEVLDLVPDLPTT